MKVTDYFWLEEGVIEVVKVHVDLIGRDQDGGDTKDKGGIELVAYCGFDAVLIAVNEAIRWNVAFIHHCLLC